MYENIKNTKTTTIVATSYMIIAWVIIYGGRRNTWLLLAGALSNLQRFTKI